MTRLHGAPLPRPSSSPIVLDPPTAPDTDTALSLQGSIRGDDTLIDARRAAADPDVHVRPRAVRPRREPGERRPGRRPAAGGRPAGPRGRPRHLPCVAADR